MVGTMDFNESLDFNTYGSIKDINLDQVMSGYQTIAKYNNDNIAVVIQFTNTVDFDGYNWSLSEIMYNQTVKILKNKN